MKIETKIKRVQKLCEDLDLINKRDYTKKYFSSEKRARAEFYFNKNNLINIQGSVFIVDTPPKIKNK